MSRSKTTISSLLLALTVFISYQNCAPSKKERDNPNNDKVTKIEQLGVDASDDDIIVAAQKLSVGENDPIAFGLEECRRSMGTDRRNCIWDNIRKLYIFLRDVKGFSVSEETADCFLAVSKTSLNLGQPLQIISTCYNSEPSRAHEHVVHLDECFDNNNALATFIRTRNFEHLDFSIEYKTSSVKKVQILARDRINGTDFTDACGQIYQVLLLDLFKDINVK